MRLLLLLLPGLVLPPARGVAQDDRPIEERAAVALHVAAPRVFQGQATDVTLRVELEQRLVREHLIQLFQQRTDVAVRIRTPWAGPLEGFAVQGPPPGFRGTATAVVDGTLAALRRGDDLERGALRFAVFELVCRLVPRRAGVLTIRGAELAFSWAAQFEEDFFGELVPRDRQDARLVSAPLELVVDELPAAGRPRDFTGLVGTVTARAELVAEATVRVGEGLLLRLVVAGDGDLQPFVAPRLADVPAFHARGVREEHEPGRRIASYELVALRAGVQRIPALSIPTFDPAAARYATATTEPLTVAVAPAADGTTAIDAVGRAIESGAAAAATDAAKRPEASAAAPIPGIDVLFDLLPVGSVPQRTRPDFGDPQPLPLPWLATGLLLPWLAALGMWTLRSHNNQRELRARQRRRRAAWRSFQRELGEAGADRGAALASYLAAWLDCAPAAVVSPSLPQHLAATGIDQGLAHAVDRAIDQLAAARFGGGEPPRDEVLLELVGRLDRELRRRQHKQWQQPAGKAALAPAVAMAAALWLPLLAQEPAPRDVPAEAARRYAAGEIAQAATLYRQALDAGGFDAAALCFDLGNCAHRLGRPAEAVLWYLRALRIAPHHLQARANLRLVRQQLGLGDAGPRTLLGTWLEGALARLGAAPAGLWLGLAAALQVGGFGLLLLRRRRRGGGGVLLVAGLLLAGLAARDNLRDAGQTAVVLRDGVRLLLEPHARAGAVANLRTGETIAVLEASPRWARVRRGSDDGWIESRAFERVALR